MEAAPLGTASSFSPHPPLGLRCVTIYIALVLTTRLCLSLALLILAADATAAWAFDYSRLGLNLYGLSYHLDRRDQSGQRFNEFNPGGGVSFVFHEHGKSHYSVEGGIFVDSYRKRATYFVLGYEYDLFKPVGIGMVFGVYDSRAVSLDGPIVAAAPFAAIHYRRLCLRVVHLPEFPGINPYPSFASYLIIALGSRPQAK